KQDRTNPATAALASDADNEHKLAAIARQSPVTVRVVSDAQFGNTASPMPGATHASVNSGVSNSVSPAVSDSLKGDGVLLRHSEQWSQIEKSNVVSQVIEKARLFRWENNSEIIISLKPESLGRISVRAAMVDQTIVATIVAESDKVRSLLQSELPALHRALQQDGIPARIDVAQAREPNFAAGGGGQPHLHQN